MALYRPGVSRLSRRNNDGEDSGPSVPDEDSPDKEQVATTGAQSESWAEQMDHLNEVTEDGNKGDSGQEKDTGRGKGKQRGKKPDIQLYVPKHRQQRTGGQDRQNEIRPEEEASAVIASSEEDQLVPQIGADKGTGRRPRQDNAHMGAGPAANEDRDKKSQREKGKRSRKGGRQSSGAREQTRERQREQFSPSSPVHRASSGVGNESFDLSDGGLEWDYQMSVSESEPLEGYRVESVPLSKGEQMRGDAELSKHIHSNLPRDQYLNEATVSDQSSNHDRRAKNQQERFHKDGKKSKENEKQDSTKAGTKDFKQAKNIGVSSRHNRGHSPPSSRGDSEIFEPGQFQGLVITNSKYEKHQEDEKFDKSHRRCDTQENTRRKQAEIRTDRQHREESFQRNDKNHRSQPHQSQKAKSKENQEFTNARHSEGKGNSQGQKGQGQKGQRGREDHNRHRNRSGDVRSPKESPKISDGDKKGGGLRVTFAHNERQVQTSGSHSDTDKHKQQLSPMARHHRENVPCPNQAERSSVHAGGLLHLPASAMTSDQGQGHIHQGNLPSPVPVRGRGRGRGRASHRTLYDPNNPTKPRHVPQNTQQLHFHDPYDQQGSPEAYSPHYSQADAYYQGMARPPAVAGSYQAGYEQSFQQEYTVTGSPHGQGDGYGYRYPMTYHQEGGHLPDDTYTRDPYYHRYLLVSGCPIIILTAPGKSLHN